MKDEKIRVWGYVTAKQKEILREQGKTHESGMGGIVSDLIVRYLTGDDPKLLAEAMGKLNDATSRINSDLEFIKQVGTKVNTIELLGNSKFFDHTLLRIDALNEISKKVDSFYDNKLQQDATLNEQAETIRALESTLESTLEINDTAMEHLKLIGDTLKISTDFLKQVPKIAIPQYAEACKDAIAQSSLEIKRLNQTVENEKNTDYQRLIQVAEAFDVTPDANQKLDATALFDLCLQQVKEINRKASQLTEVATHLGCDVDAKSIISILEENKKQWTDGLKRILRSLDIHEKAFNVNSLSNLFDLCLNQTTEKITVNKNQADKITALEKKGDDYSNEIQKLIIEIQKLINGFEYDNQIINVETLPLLVSHCLDAFSDRLSEKFNLEMERDTLKSDNSHKLKTINILREVLNEVGTKLGFPCDDMNPKLNGDDQSIEITSPVELQSADFINLSIDNLNTQIKNNLGAIKILNSSASDQETRITQLQYALAFEKEKGVFQKLWEKISGNTKTPPAQS